MSYSIGTDIGGTFTDCVIVDDGGQLVTGKAPSTPADFAGGFFAAIEDAASKLDASLEQVLGDARTLVHATTAGSNAVVERKGALVGLITTKGHADAIFIMRGGGRVKGLDVDAMLDIPATRKPDPIVAREYIVEVAERVDSFGEVLVELDEDAVRRGVRQLVDAGAEAIAISFLWSFLHPEHEQRAREIAEQEAPGVFISCSHEIAPQLGEYYRTVATVMNGYLGPLMLDYTQRIASTASERGYSRPALFAQCVGGATRVDTIERVPLFTMDSGPVSGVVAAQFLGERFGHQNIITADMGGTTLDVCVIPDGVPHRRDTRVINQYEMFLPMLGVESIGAGGGSIAWIDPASHTIKVGPHSAGADPGPVCYGAGGTEPTVTDANLVLGVLNPGSFLGGRRRLDLEAARAAVGALGEPLGLSPEETAAGIVEIIDLAMAEQIRRMTVSRGHDVRDFVLFGFGGGSGAHAASFAAELDIEKAIIPLGDLASVLSAMGTVASDVAHVYERSVRHVEPYDMDAVREVFAELDGQASEQLTDEGFGGDEIELAHFALMKYGAQVYDLEVTFEDDDTAQTLIERFEAEYAAQFGRDSGYRPAGIEIIRQRTYARGRLPRPVVGDDGGGSRNGAASGAPSPVGSRPVWWREHRESVDTPVYDATLPTHRGARLSGPAIVDLPDTTVVVRPGNALEVDAHGNLVIEVRR